jgi:STAS domain-containing protein/XFP-like protein
VFPGPYGRGWLGDGPNTEPVTLEGSELAAVRTAKDSAELELSVVRRLTHKGVGLRGEIDVATAPGLRDRLLTLLRCGMGPIILDLSEVLFCDASAAVGQTHLLDDPLLREPVRAGHVKPRLLGHRRTTPGLNLFVRSGPPRRRRRHHDDPVPRRRIARSRSAARLPDRSSPSR